MQSLLPMIFCHGRDDSSSSSPVHPRQVHHTLCGRLNKNDPNIKTVEFRYQNIDLQRLAKAVANNTNLETLELIASVQSIEAGIPANDEVEHIYYDDYDEHSSARDRCCDIMIQPPRWPLGVFFPNETYSGCSRGIYAVCYDGLIYNKGLVGLDLSQNYLGRFGASCLQQALKNHPTLKKLNLARCHLEYDGLQRIAHSKLGVLEELDLSHNRISDGYFLGKILCHNVNLKNLDVSFNYLGNRECVLFLTSNGFGALQSLNLTSNRINDIGAASLGRALRFSHTVIKELVLDANPLGDIGAMNLGSKGLIHNTSLVKLSLQKCNIGDKGATTIANCLAHHQSMKELYLTSNYLSTKGAMACLQTFLTKLDLAYNNIRSDGELMSILRCSNVRLETLSIRQNPMRKSHWREIDFWTTLNATGGRRILQCQQSDSLSPVPITIWPTILEQVANRPDCIFYLLKQVPELAVQSKIAQQEQIL